MNDIGEKIKKLRNAKNLTQSELAERLNVTKSTISAYENNTRMPSYDVLIKIAELFHVTIDNILGYSDRHVIDVTGLTYKQINTIQDVVITYQQCNRLLKCLAKEDLILSNLISSGIIGDEI